MNLYDVYPLYQIEPVKGQRATIWDDKGNKYLDFYGGHAVISIGHSHPYYVGAITDQLQKIGFYSNSVLNPLQHELADLLIEVSGVKDYSLFLCNSGAESNENALKLASFYRPDSNKVIAFKNGFHGRTSAAVNVTDNPKIQSAFNKSLNTVLFSHSEEDAMIAEIKKGDAGVVILEVIQGVGGLDMLNDNFLVKISEACKATNTVLIADEVQSGYGRTGKFFAFQHAGIEPDIITMAKGMGNGFPIGGLLINKKFKPWHGQLGTTFGGNHLACAAGIAVLEVIKNEELLDFIKVKSAFISNALNKLPGIKKVKGKGLMIGAEFEFPVKELRKSLIFNQHLFTGSAKDPNVLRLLPPLNITADDIENFISKITVGVTQFLKQENYA